MKKTISLFVLLITLTLAMSAGGGNGNNGNGSGNKIPPPPPAVNVSPSIYTAPAPITYTASGFAAGGTVFIDVEGPDYFWIYAIADANGNLSVDYPSGIIFTPGYYTVTATQTVVGSGNKSTTRTATTGLEVD